ncbi:putative quinol monooxygenase [Actibacterium pelagium]|uniref:ABM domain-containing protein n=1 Tax=Actibacterium pelagium TaxID=2029103 RepID=A0A917AGM2_9RHOB|nr:antibiotic biosynthesis monooxygenase [Actibacterium pelagium]GGE51074.1 hypothetical protein GCM10011517_18560 [Actibacterium pelagium]
MGEFANSVRFSVKPDCVSEFLAAFDQMEKWTGLESHRLVQTGETSFVSFGEWESEAALVAARPSMIAFLDTFRGFLEEISPALGVTDPVSGAIVKSR